MVIPKSQDNRFKYEIDEAIEAEKERQTIQPVEPAKATILESLAELIPQISVREYDNGKLYRLYHKKAGHFIGKLNGLTFVLEIDQQIPQEQQAKIKKYIGDNVKWITFYSPVPDYKFKRQNPTDWERLRKDEMIRRR